MSVFNSPFNQVFHNPFGSPFNGDASSGTTWTPAEWFLASEQGAWYDPSDFSTMFQDSAGTTPVTAVEQPVGKIIDKSGRGNHATQSTAASRPVLSARKNKLLATTTLATQAVTLTASPNTLSFKGTGTVTLSGASTAGPLVGTGAGNRVSLTFTPSAGSVTFTVSGSVTEAQLEDGGAATTYQRVTTNTDYDTVGFPHYLKFDGVDDSLSTASIDFTATDKMTVVAGARKLSDIAGILAELSANYNSNDGSFYVAAGTDSGCQWSSTSRGTATPLASSIYGSITATGAETIVGTWTHDIAGDQTRMRKNGVLATSSGSATGDADKGAGNFGNYPLYIGSRAGTSSPFNGNLNQLIVRGTATTLADIQKGEKFVAGKTGVILP